MLPAEKLGWCASQLGSGSAAVVLVVVAIKCMLGLANRILLSHDVLPCNSGATTEHSGPVSSARKSSLHHLHYVSYKTCLAILIDGTKDIIDFTHL